MDEPCQGANLIDVASGTGDIARLFSMRNKNLSEVICVEPNKEMFLKGQINLKTFKNIKWIKSSAELLPVQDNVFDFYTISFGIKMLQI